MNINLWACCQPAGLSQQELLFLWQRTFACMATSIVLLYHNPRFGPRVHPSLCPSISLSLSIQSRPTVARVNSTLCTDASVFLSSTLLEIIVFGTSEFLYIHMKSGRLVCLWHSFQTFTAVSWSTQPSVLSNRLRMLFHAFDPKDWKWNNVVILP